MSDPLTIHVTSCSRCGGDHGRLSAKAFARPVDVPEAGGVVWTHWVMCPTSLDPILVNVTDAPGGRLTDEVVAGLKHFADVAEVEGQIGERDAPAIAWLKSRGWREEDPFSYWT